MATRSAANVITRCLSVRNPWASLIVLGLKGIENRTWTTNYRGRIAIHASSKPSEIAAYRQFLEDPPLVEDHSRQGFVDYLDEEFDPEDPENQETSVIIGTVEIVDVIDTEADDFDESQLDIKSPGFDFTWEFAAFGDVRYLWVLANPMAFETPIGCHGKLNLWNLTPELQAAVAREERIAREAAQAEDE